MHTGYYRYPCIYNDLIVFVADGDLWSCSSKGGQAKRITNLNSEVTFPSFSPDGKRIAFIAKEGGNNDLYVIDIDGGNFKRLSYLGGSMLRLSCWSQDGKHLIISSNAKQPLERIANLYKVPVNGGTPSPLHLGRAHEIAYGTKNRSVIGRHLRSYAYWKR